MKSQKGIGGFLRKKQELRNQTEKNNVKTAGRKVKKKDKKIVKRVVLNTKVNKVKVWINFVNIEIKVLKKVRNKVSYIVKMKSQGDNGGLIMKMGYITVGYMTQKVIHIVEILTNLECRVWCKIKLL